MKDKEKELKFKIYQKTLELKRIKKEIRLLKYELIEYNKQKTLRRKKDKNVR